MITSPLKALLVRNGNALYLASRLDEPLPIDVYSELTYYMQYRHVTRLYGREAFGKSSGQRIKTEQRKLFSIDDYGCLNFPAGYYDRVQKILASQGYQICYVDDSPQFPQQLEWHWDNLGSFQFRPRQEEALRTIEAAYKARRGGVIDAAAGFGKTELFAALAMLLPTAQILICVKSTDNVQKTIRVLLRYLPQPSIGQRGAGRAKQARVTVATAASVGNYAGTADLFLGDEVHELLAETYVADIVTTTPQAIRFGFTATVEGRSDNADARMEAVFGGTLFKLTYPEAVGLKLVVPIEVRWQRVEMGGNPTKGLQGDTARKRHGIWTNKVRNAHIAKIAQKHYEEGDQILVLVDKIEHLLHLARLMPDFALCYGNIDEADEGYYRKYGLLPVNYTPLTVAVRKQLREDFEAGKIRGAIATGVWRLGVSFDALAALIWAGGGSSPIDATQGPSRVSRIHDESGKEYGVVYDFNDEFDEQFYKQAMARRRVYKKHAWVQIEPAGTFSSSGVARMFFT
jgi:superfamily II DNA or RNA helicase